MTDRRPLVVANWKMHGSRQMVAELVAGVVSGIAKLSIDVVICPPAVFLEQAKQCAASSSLMIGAQNVNAHEPGAYTGEIAPNMLAEVGCRYVIVGHSERRTLYKETDDEVAAKCVAVLKMGMTPIVCVGETLHEREEGQTEAVIHRQLIAVLGTVAKEDISRLVVAYEPVWAIGTGKTASTDQAQAVHAQIRQWLCGIDLAAGKKVRILYGGSVKANNAAALFEMQDIDGGLVGGASLSTEEFVAICLAAELKEREH